MGISSFGIERWVPEVHLPEMCTHGLLDPWDERERGWVRVPSPGVLTNRGVHLGIWLANGTIGGSQSTSGFVRGSLGRSRSCVSTHTHPHTCTRTTPDPVDISEE